MIYSISLYERKKNRAEDTRFLKGVYEEKSFHFFYWSNIIIQEHSYNKVFIFFVFYLYNKNNKN